jgi:ABC-type multidrug transport system ATPase subunit
VYYWDNPTRGLDASASLEFAVTIRSSTRNAHYAAIEAEYQAGENFTLTFEKVTTVYLDRQIFFGALDDAKSHFEGLGFQSKARQTTADFLTAITYPTGRRVMPGWEHKAPRSPDDFVKEPKYYAQLRHEIDQYKASLAL